MSKRIPYLDTLRFLAILMVMLYHFTNPYTTPFPHPYIFRYGGMGVYLFFAISGYIIPYTLENTPAMRLFVKKRFWRLAPAMILCSVLTLIIARCLDSTNLFPEAHQLKNLLPGLTFINHAVWTEVTGIPFNWINGSYWTLWLEVQFYIIVAIVYYWRKESFQQNFMIIAILISASKYIPIFLHLDGWKYVDELFNITFFIGWFALGTFFYNGGKKLTALLLLFLLIADNFLFLDRIPTLICLVITIGLFQLIQKNYRQHPLVVRIGKTSYSLYLIHEIIGIILINRYWTYLGVATPFVVMVLCMGFAELSYRFFETKLFIN